MNITDAQHKALLKVIEQGVDKSTDSLAKITHTNWSMSTVSLSSGPGEKLPNLLASAPESHYGAYFSAAPVAFLAMFPGNSGREVSKAFLKGSGPRMSSVAELEKNSIAEISNILVNAVAGVMADTLETSILVSAPEMLTGSKTDLIKAVIERAKPDRNYAMMSYVSMSSADLSTDCILVILFSGGFLNELLSVIEI